MAPGAYVCVCCGVKNFLLRLTQPPSDPLPYTIPFSVVDAILGALSMPDIGQLFPDNDPRLKGSNSEIFMEEAYKRMTERGYAIGNCDVTLILQRPKVETGCTGWPSARVVRRVSVAVVT